MNHTSLLFKSKLFILAALNLLTIGILCSGWITFSFLMFKPCVEWRTSGTCVSCVWLLLLTVVSCSPTHLVVNDWMPCCLIAEVCVCVCVCVLRSFATSLFYWVVWVADLFCLIFCQVSSLQIFFPFCLVSLESVDFFSLLYFHLPNFDFIPFFGGFYPRGHHLD